ncbi:cysteine hydrolase family protein [Enterococcus larvae]|uniref:cysteine hydrolase family protein n=1 Tax=Enterococcus larvae TaxID=2794352 RepID=UPI003F2ED4C2
MGNRGLLIIDLQKGLESEEEKLYQLDEVLAQTNERIDDYRKKSLPIIFVQHEDEELIVNSEGWQLFPALHAEKEDIYIGKTHANSFYQTDLLKHLQLLSIEELEICGAQTEYCVDTTIRMAHGLGYQLYMKKGTVTTLDNGRLAAAEIIAHHEAIWDRRFLTFL